MGMVMVSGYGLSSLFLKHSSKGMYLQECLWSVFQDLSIQTCLLRLVFPGLFLRTCLSSFVFETFLLRLVSQDLSPKTDPLSPKFCLS